MNKTEIANRLILNLIKKNWGIETPFTKRVFKNIIVVSCRFGEFVLDRLSFNRDIKMYQKYQYLEV